MPKAFDSCQKAGGKIRTVGVSKDKYMRVCVRPGGQAGKRGGRTVAGHVRTRQTPKK